jgi:hypothetical protein
MPAPIDEIIKRRVVQQWLAGDSRPKIAIDNNIGEGTVSGIVSEFKIGLDSSEFDSARELALQAKKQGFNLSELASHSRLYNYFLKSGAAEDKIESFITKVSSNDIPPERVIELVYQLYEISKAESIPLDQISNHIKQKLEQKKKIDEQIKEADAILQSKNVSIEAVRYKDVIPFTEEIVAFGIGIQELIGLEVAIKEAAKMYNLPFFASTMKLIEDVKSYNKIGGLKRELQRLSLQKYALDQACSRQNQSLINLAKLKSCGVTEGQIISFNNFLESNRYTSTK